MFVVCILQVLTFMNLGDAPGDEKLEGGDAGVDAEKFFGASTPDS